MSPAGFCSGATACSGVATAVVGCAGALVTGCAAAVASGSAVGGNAAVGRAPVAGWAGAVVGEGRVLAWGDPPQLLSASAPANRMIGDERVLRRIHVTPQI